jgi:RND family efflux transporter MFP subunit
MRSTKPVGLLAFFGLFATTFPAAAQRPETVFISPVIEREVQAGQSFVGSVRPVKSSTIGSAVDGRVEKFPVNEGDFVKEGTPLAELRTGTLKIELKGAEAELRLREAELKELENGSRKEEIEQARAGLAAADAKRTYARAFRERAERLFRTGRSSSEQEVQEAISLQEVAEQTYLQAKATLDLALAGPRKEKIEQARARKEAQAELVRKIEDQIFLHTIRAPFDGYVSTEHCELGQWLNKGQPLVEMVKLDEVDVEAWVTEEAVGNLRVGAPARIDVNGLGDRTFTGSVTLIVPQANPRTRTFPVKVRVPNTLEGGTPLLKSNMIARVTLPVGKKENGLLVPKDAVVLGGPSPMVYVAMIDSSDPKKGTARPVPVQLGVAHAGLMQVKGELKVGDKIVSQGNERVFPNQPLIVLGELDPEAAPVSVKK